MIPNLKARKQIKKKSNNLEQDYKEELKTEFKQFLYTNKNLIFDSPFENLLKIGISVVKCPTCITNRVKSNKCPTCNDNIREVR